MLTYLLAAILVATAVAAAGPIRNGIRALRAAGIRRGCRRPTVVVQTIDRRSIRGVLVREGVLKLVLEHAEFLSGGDRAPFSGRAVIPRSNVSWWQELDATAASEAYRDPAGEAAS